MSKALDAAVALLLAEAQTAFTSSADPADIQQSAEALRKLISAWRVQDQRVEATVIGLLRLVQARCPHAGAQHGRNERDGSWMTPCPTCGASA